MDFHKRVRHVGASLVILSLGIVLISTTGYHSPVTGRPQAAAAAGLAAPAVLNSTTTLVHTSAVTSTATVTPTNTATNVPTRTMTPTVTATPRPTSTPTVPPTMTPTTVATSALPLPTHIPATATFTPLITPSIVITPSTISPGGIIAISGTSFTAQEPVTITLDTMVLTKQTTTVTGMLGLMGLNIPYTTTVGVHTITVSGTSTRQTATAQIHVVALTPSLTLSATGGLPGQQLSIHGCGYGASEGITLALNGSSISTTPTILTSTVGGCFSATATIPASALSGLNTLAATGSSSLASSFANFTVILPVTSSWYFSGASTMAGETATVALVNLDNQPATINITMMYADGHSPTHSSLTIAAHSRSSFDVGTLVGANKQVGIVLTADRHIGAQMTEYRSGQDRWATLGTSAPSSTWYFAEGYTGLTFHENLTILNPGTTPAVVTLHLLPFNGKPARTVVYAVAAQQELPIAINPLLPAASLSIIVTSSQPIIAQRTMTFGTGGFGATAKVGTNLSSSLWYFAEGSTLNTFETYLTVLNPNQNQAALVTASYYSATGASLGNQTIVIDPLHRGNFKINDVARSSSIATIVTSNVAIVVERPMYFGAPNAGPTGGSDVFGRNGTGISWVFPSGNTGGGAQEFLLIQNPTPHVANLTVKFYTTTGSIISLVLSVPPFSRHNINVNRDVPGLPASEHSTVLQSTNNVGVVVEQSTYDSSFRVGDSTQGQAQ